MNPPLKLAFCAALSAVIWFFPLPEGLEPRAWHVFAVFVGVIFSFILRPYPMGVTVIIGLVFLSITEDIGIEDALRGYGESVVWLVVAAFLIAGGVERTGIGRRIALILVRKFGKSPTGIGYSLCGAELLLGPVVPSVTARGGGILAPIMQSLASTLKSTPENEPRRAGEYLALVGAHANLVTAAMFLTGMAANPLVAQAAKDVMNIDFGWGTWALGAIVPGLISLAGVPLIISVLAKPTLTDTREAQKEANKLLMKLGNWSRGEIIMAFVFVILVVLWSTKPYHGMPTTLVAWIGVCLLLLSGTEKWANVTANHKAWDTLVWLGGLLTMATILKNYGFIQWFADNVGGMVQGMDGVLVAVILALIYFYSMYMFSMLTAHIVAMVAAFLTLCAGAGAPSMLSIALLAYFSNLCATTTYYSTGPVVIYFGLGYVQPNTWLRVGFLMSLYHLVIWLGIGMPWWKLLGWW